MKKIFIIILLLIFYLELFPQNFIKSVSAFADYNSGIANKEFLKIDRSYGIGGGVKVDFYFNDYLSFNLSGGYNEFVIEQEEHALFLEWNWKSWKRYFGDINDPNFARATQWVQSILKDSNYSATFEPVQRMDFYPVLINTSVNLKFSSGFELNQSLGVGIIFYSRRLYVNENWSKRFAALNNYIFSYSYRNIAENINGNPFVVSTGLDFRYPLSELFALYGEINYIHVIKTPNKFGYDDFPSDNLLNVKFGITFLY